jgi:hypothetical protein
MPADSVKREGSEGLLRGLEELLDKHSPVELSSICGTLRLPVQQRGYVSKQSILDYANKGNQVVEARVHQILHGMWEGVLVDYCKANNDLYRTTMDPVSNVLLLWAQGGLTGAGKRYTNHFFSREILKTYADVTYPDLIEKLAALRLAQEKLKNREMAIYRNNDYDMIIAYTVEIHKLAAEERAFRQFLSIEVETLRARTDLLDATILGASKAQEIVRNELRPVVHGQLLDYASVCESQAVALSTNRMRNELQVRVGWLPSDF